MRSFALGALGLTLVDGEFLESTAANGDKLEGFGPSRPQPAYQFGAAPVVVRFLVDDIEPRGTSSLRHRRSSCSASWR
jgi:hypothetical protein